MEVDEVIEQAAPEKILALKASNSDEEFELDKEQVSFITKNFSKFFKKKREQVLRNIPMTIQMGATNMAKLIIRSEIVQFGK